MTTYKFTITEEMVKSPSRYWRNKWTPERARLNETMGPLRINDIGKRVYEVRGENGYSFFQVENDAQRDARLRQG